ncbi:hypothetical protein [Delftia tsuruhatensis]|uniref:hypothetical protein n=1 Tax=Delftia tsuruhatensis TaxID=180282 RepID=UPI001F204768|nr:hypothetical protein [Delftia tsuruhatensis]
MNMAHGGKIEPLDRPISTIATEAGGCRALVSPTLIQMSFGEGKDSGKRRSYGASPAVAEEPANALRTLADLLDKRAAKAAASQATAGRVLALHKGHHGAQPQHGRSPQSGSTASGLPTSFDTLAGSCNQGQGDGMGKFRKSPCCGAQPSEAHRR